MPQHSSPFAVLGLTRDCTLDQARIAFRKLALKFHPDKVPADQKETATAKMALLNAAMEKVNEILGNASRVQGSSTHTQCSKSRENDKPKALNPSPSVFERGDKDKARELSQRHAKLFHRIEQIAYIIITRTSSQGCSALTSIVSLEEYLQSASKAAREESLESARSSTNRIQNVVEAIKNKVKELERRANSRRTIGGQYRPEEIEALNHTVSSLVTDLLTGKMRLTGTE
jgi:hypothetical protein